MLNYRVNIKNINKTKVVLPVTSIQFIDFDEIYDENEIVEYNGINNGKVILTCQCKDIDKLKNDSTINAVNILTLNYGTYTFNNKFKVKGVNQDNRSFSIISDKYYTLKPFSIIRNSDINMSGTEQLRGVALYLNEPHYYDGTYFLERIYTNGIDVISEKDYEELTDEDKKNYNVDTTQKIPICFRYTDKNGEFKEVIVEFKYFSSDTLVTTLSAFEKNEDTSNLYKLIFKTAINEKVENEISGDLSGIEILRENFLFTRFANYYFEYERAVVNVPIPLSNSFDTNLYQSDLLQEYFFKEEERKTINKIVDLEKDVYYPVIKDGDSFSDVYTLRFNLHFREHRGDNWLVDYVKSEDWMPYKQYYKGDCVFYNGNVWHYQTSNTGYFYEDAVGGIWRCKEDNTGFFHEGTKKFVFSDRYFEKIEEKSFWNGVKQENGVISIDEQITGDGVSDLLCFLDFTNNDIRYQKNKLKKSFLRLSFYDSMNPANQNMLGYSTIFLDSGKLFSKYVRYFETDGYKMINYNKNAYGIYDVEDKPKKGNRVNREYNFDEEYRLSSQFVVKNKNTSTASSEGFYLYLWKDNESVLPQDLYMKVEFNHAGYGRTMPFMMPYWDKQKWDNKKSGIKTFNEILNDWKSDKYTYYNKYNEKDLKTEDEYLQLTEEQRKNYLLLEVFKWKVDNTETDGHYGMKQYMKFSYIHLKYKYDKDNDKHIYYLDPETYGDINFPTGKDGNKEIVINLYEAKVE